MLGRPPLTFIRDPARASVMRELSGALTPNTPGSVFAKAKTFRFPSGKIDDTAIIDRGRLLGRASVDLGGFGANLDGFGHLADFQNDVGPDVLIHRDNDSGVPVALESGELRFDGIDTRDESEHLVVAGGVGIGCVLEAGLFVGYGNADARHECAGLVFSETTDGCVPLSQS